MTTATHDLARARGPLPSLRSPSHAGSDTSDPDVIAAHEHLDYLVWAWPDLVQHRLHGTERPWSEQGAPATATARQRAEQAAERARIERLERIGLAPGERPAPLRVDVLDQLHAIVAATTDIASALADVLSLRLADLNAVRRAQGAPDLAAPAVDPRDWLMWSRTQLLSAQALDDRCAPWVAATLSPVVAAVAYALGDVADGQLLAGLCPWCGGRGPDGLEGARTLRVRYPALGRDGQPVVVCTGLHCDPPALSRAHRTDDDQPCWHQHDWDHLAARLEPLA